MGTVTAILHEDGRVGVRNVLSHRAAARVSAGGFTGDVAWGGNWFFLVADHGLDLSLTSIHKLTAAAIEAREAVRAAGYPEVDHIEFFAAPHDPVNHSRNFVLCPGAEYDRSPCGTGTSAKIACLAADGKLAPVKSGVRKASLERSSKEATRPPQAGSSPPSPAAPTSSRRRSCCLVRRIRSGGGLGVKRGDERVFQRRWTRIPADLRRSVPSVTKVPASAAICGYLRASALLFLFLISAANGQDPVFRNHLTPTWLPDQPPSGIASKPVPTPTNSFSSTRGPVPERPPPTSPRSVCPRQDRSGLPTLHRSPAKPPHRSFLRDPPRQ